jgi:oligopeptide/dipeptide ABC transporter ATP-binding protein
MLLEIENLVTHFKVQQGWVRAVDGVSVTLKEGETLGLVGESGCGKTTLGYAISQLLPDNAYVHAGKVFFREPEEVRKHRLAYAARAKESPQWKGDSVEPLSTFFKKEYEKLKRERRRLAQDRRSRTREDLKDVQNRLDALEERYNLLAITRLPDGRLKEYEPEMNVVRWKEISMIFQGAMNAFNPVYTIGAQIMEAIQTHEELDDDEARERVIELFDLVGIPPDRIDHYPHEYSGGMRQRAIIAMALALDPKLVIADEPTTALDVIMQDRILGEIRDIQRKLRMAMMIITHDVSVVAEVAHKIAVMYAGQIVEAGTATDIFKDTAHPYTEGLLNAFPSILGEKRRLESIPGSPPSLLDPPEGCRFHPRCKYAKDICKVQDPPYVVMGDGHISKCHFAEELFGEGRGVQ